MNRKTLPVCRSTIRRRTLIDVAKRLQQIRDDYAELTDSQAADLTESDFGHDSGQFLEMGSNCSLDSACAASEPVVVFAESSTEVNADMSERLVFGDCDDQAHSSDSEHSDEEVFETFSLSDNIANWAIHFGISLVALTALLGILRMGHPELPKDGRTLLRTKTKYSIQERAGGQYYYHFLGDSDDSDDEHPRKKSRSRPKPSTQPPAPAVPPPPAPAVPSSPAPAVPSSPDPAVPPPPCRLTSNSTVICPPPSPPQQMDCRRPSEQTLSAHLVHTPTWRGGRFDSSTLPSTATLVQILTLLEHQKIKMEQIDSKLNYLTSRLDSMPQEMEAQVPVHFPLASVEEVDSFENWLKDPAHSQQKQKLISSLAAIGGHDTKRITWNILAHIYHDDVGRQINWKGVNGKKSFNQMSSKTLVLHSVRKNPISRASTDHEICKHAIRWFNLAADRDCSRRRHGTQEAEPADHCLSLF